MLKITDSNIKLNILLNNTNKALVQVLLDATKDDLKTISKESGDLRSIMSKILKQTDTSEPASNKVMLELVKKNPTLNNLGDTNKTIKELISTIKSDKNPLPIEKVLKDILIDIKDIKKVEIKHKLDNTGLFLESKLKDVKNPQVELKETVVQLKELVKGSKLPIAKEIIKLSDDILKNQVIKSATNNDTIKDKKQNPKLLEQVSSNVKSLTNKLQNIIKSTDAVFSPKANEIINKLEFTNNIQIKEEPNLKSLALNVDEKVQKKIEIPLPLQNMQKAKLNQVQQVVKNSNTSNVSEIKIPNDNVIKLSIIKEALQALQVVLDKSLTLESKVLLKSIPPILSSLESTKELTAESKQDISRLITDTKTLIQKADVIYSKDLITLFTKLKSLNSAHSLNPQTNVKEIISNDLKSVLIQTSQELQDSSHPNKNELIKQMDKLMLQIDHHQLLSHLSNGTSVYLPISWDLLEGGNLEVRKDNDKFYCDIELQLKEYGDVSVKLTLFEKNQININMYSPNQKLKELFHEHISILRAGMISSQIIPREIRFHDGVDKKQTAPYQADNDEFNMGFEVKG